MAIFYIRDGMDTFYSKDFFKVFISLNLSKGGENFFNR